MNLSLLLKGSGAVAYLAENAVQYGGGSAAVCGAQASSLDAGNRLGGVICMQWAEKAPAAIGGRNPARIP